MRKNYLGTEATRVKSFCNFLRNNIPLIIAVSVTLLKVSKMVLNLDIVEEASIG